MRTPARSSSRTVASIRQLCSMALPEEIFMAKFLEVVREWLGCDTSHFIWCEAKSLLPVNYSGDGFTDISAVQRFFNHNSKIDYPGVMPAFADLMRTNASGTLGCAEEGADAYLRSDLYQDVMRPCDGRYMLYLVAHDIRGAPKGLLSLLRSSTDKPFSAADHEKLAQLEPYLRHALSVNIGVTNAFESADSEGLVVLNRDGALRYQDHEARRLLYMASHDRIDGNALIHLDSHNITPQLKRLHQRLVFIFEGRNARPPFFECRNSWGKFVFKGSWLDGAHEKAVGVRVLHFIPRSLKAWKGLHRLDLAPRQQEVALLFSEGRTVAEISDQLSISRHTVAEYVKVIYERLEIDPNREALQQVLLA
jgi:DNA-binding CsgD family transcriptional regulator